MLVIIVCSYVHEFWSSAIKSATEGKETIELMTDSEIRTDMRRYVRADTGTQIEQAARLYEQIQIKLLPCYHLLPDINNINRVLSRLRTDESRKVH